MAPATTPKGPPLPSQVHTTLMTPPTFFSTEKTWKKHRNWSCRTLAASDSQSTVGINKPKKTQRRKQCSYQHLDTLQPLVTLQTSCSTTMNSSDSAPNSNTSEPSTLPTHLTTAQQTSEIEFRKHPEHSWQWKEYSKAWKSQNQRESERTKQQSSTFSCTDAKAGPWKRQTGKSWKRAITDFSEAFSKFQCLMWKNNTLKTQRSENGLTATALNSIWSSDEPDGWRN